MGRRLWVGAVLGLLGALATSPARADFVLYHLPGTSLALVLRGEASVNPGRTITCRHPLGNLHFDHTDVQIIQSPSPAEQYQRVKGEKNRVGTVDAMLELAAWCVDNGELRWAREALSEGYKLAPEDPRIQKMVLLNRYLTSAVPEDPEAESEMREFLKGKEMKVARSRHFLLMHDTDDRPDPRTRRTPAEQRLELLEQVYDSFYMNFALRGKYLRIPKEPLRVVLFNDHADYLTFVTRLDPDLKKAAGFYDPEHNVAIFYRQQTDEGLEGHNQLADIMRDLQESAKRARSSSSAALIRFAKTLELLLRITGENLDIEVVSHEATHQLAANSGLLPRDKFIARWAHEGLAAYYESPSEATWAGIGAVNEQRLEYYRALAPDREHSNLEFIVTDRIFLQAANNEGTLHAYGQAWALTHFLMDRHFEQLMSFYARMSEEGESEMLVSEWQERVLEIFRDEFGDLELLEDDWRRYMRSLKTDMQVLMQ
ncbi:DUF1570 domain-containing protein [Candidatus Laterigemmans baculatus]|uniref:DUF1570 domain-containing protein n=1 Tax=Candidatus Laterigemmans baculatus TaxID=2770505 RepID=UPI00193BE4E4|nr:DUF1570 domain-containing protein [Candidatus Laterigemmans baculatus]